MATPWCLTVCVLIDPTRPRPPSPHPALDAVRARLETTGFDLDDLADDPMEQFHRWFAEVRDAGVHEPHATILATVDSDGRPAARHVLLKDVDSDGFIFYTNERSDKGRQLAANPVASLCLPWNVLARQVRVVGPVERVADAEADAYFATRPRGSQVGAWASEQSAVLADRAELERRVVEATERFEGGEVPRPPHWGGYRIVPTEVEFWQGRPSRLHDRVRYRRDDTASTGWVRERLSP
jgi:pyridoxamine 5'-phosphate oxidase